ncbi:MAG: class I tRNA ligase family protein, partial [Parcubacteria group bacterium]|nr:class I tRNA ligase family protein [Parcubacteria group bacterium]
MFISKEKFSLPETEEKVLQFWKEGRIFEESLSSRRGKGGRVKTFKFFEGPPTANGRPGIHHVLARVFKDIILRYKSMRGYHVPRRAGWDTHGLPVEIAAEKELGIKNKQEIEKFGIAEFNAKAKESVWRYKDDWEKLTERIGFWLDLKNPYITYENSYIEKLWEIFKEISGRGLLKQSYKIVPFCPRCQTPLSSHELGQPGVYKKTKDPSIYVKFPLKEAKSYLLVWTTTPWTLPANMAIAVNPSLIYTKYKSGNEYLWSYSAPPVDGSRSIEVVEKLSGKKLIGLKYEPLYKNSELRTQNSKLFTVLGADFVSTEEGTGFVHIAPAFGEDDLMIFQKMLGKEFDYRKVLVTVNDGGKVIGEYPGKNKFVKEADGDIVADLERRGLLWEADTIEHEYPFCWRCSAPLLYFARLSWFIEMSRLRKNLSGANKKINWIPAHLKEGR